jgi:tetratricopeptide (TPR) repeat protein
MDALEEVFSFSLTKRKSSESEDALWINPMVHNWARERLDTQSKQKKLEEAVILCGRLCIHENVKQPHDWAFERRIWRHMNSVLRILKAFPELLNTSTFARGEILFQEVSNMGLLWDQHGLYSDAKYVPQWALDGFEKTIGKDHPNTLTAVHNRALVFKNQGQYGTALEWYGRALNGREKTLGKEHISTLDTVNSMAALFSNQGQYKKALEWYGRALEGRKKTLGKGHPSTLQTLRRFENAQSKLREKTATGP